MRAWDMRHVVLMAVVVVQFTLLLHLLRPPPPLHHDSVTTRLGDGPTVHASKSVGYGTALGEWASPPNHWPFKFYIYEELNNLDPPNCYAEKQCGKLYYCVERIVYQALKNHPSRTRNGHEAQLFFIPFSGPASYYAFTCNGTKHMQRMENLVAVLKKSPFFQRKHGADHFWPNLWWMFCKLDKKSNGGIATSYLYNHHISEGGLLRNVIFGRYIRQRSTWMPPLQPKNVSFTNDWNWIREQNCVNDEGYNFNVVSSRIVLTPIRTRNFSTSTYEQWKARPKVFHFRGRGTDPQGSNCRSQQSQRSHLARLASAIGSDSTLVDNYSKKMNYVEELRAHKFAFVVRCDDLQTSRFMEAIAENCIPVTISDGWRFQVAPFFERLNYDAFTFNIPQKMWETDPMGVIHFITSQPEHVYQSMFTALQEARKVLLWAHPESRTADWVMREAFERSQFDGVGEIPRPFARQTFVIPPRNQSKGKYPARNRERNDLYKDDDVDR